jgi:nucleoside-diphosphate-sugar epimerase
VVRALDKCDTLINLIRPDGDGTVLSALKGIVRPIADGGIRRIVHAGSVEVYGSAEAPFVTESTPPLPQTPYQLEHGALEAMWLSGSIPATLLRLGAVFGPSGRNLLSLAADMKQGRVVKLAAQRALNGRRRLHLVAVATVVDAVRRVVLAPARNTHNILLVTADGAEQNNFSFVCDRFARAFGTHVPKGLIAPTALLRLALKLRQQSSAVVTRRYSGAQLSALGIHPEGSFAADIDAYAWHLAAQTTIPS